MGYKLFLDDIRTPKKCLIYMPLSIYTEEDWIIVRNFNDFKNIIINAGMPLIVSFDHDLGEDVAKEKVFNGMSKRKARQEKKETKSGYDCVKWLVEYHISLKRPIEFPNYLIHTQNPVGGENIKSYIENYLKQL